MEARQGREIYTRFFKWRLFACPFLRGCYDGKDSHSSPVPTLAFSSFVNHQDFYKELNDFRLSIPPLDSAKRDIVYIPLLPGSSRTVEDMRGGAPLSATYSSNSASPASVRYPGSSPKASIDRFLQRRSPRHRGTLKCLEATPIIAFLWPDNVAKDGSGLGFTRSRR